MTIYQELLRLIALNHAGQWVPHHTALHQLEHFDDRLIPGLIECLRDHDPEVRCLSVELLSEAWPRSYVGLSALIEKLSDEDRLVRVAVVNRIADFGPLAAGAIPHLKRIMDVEPEYVQLLAAIAIVSLDPNRTELLPNIGAALKSENSTVRSVAREFLGKTKATMPFDEAAFEETVRSNWNYHALSEQVSWRSMQDDEGTWRCEISPVFQELWGGEDDGKKVWAGFDFHLSGFSHEPGVEFLDYGAASRCEADTPIPFIGVEGRYFGEPFVLRVNLEPLPDSEVIEVVDTVRQMVRPITDDAEAPE